MTWYAWVIVVFLALRVTSAITSIGTERSSYTPIDALWVLILNGLAIWGVVELAVK